MTVSPRRRARARAATSALLAMACLGAVTACAEDAGSDVDARSTVGPSADAATPRPTTPAAPALEAGLAKHVDGDLDGALVEYDRALQSDPKNVLALYNIGLIAQTRGDNTEAEQRYRAVLAVDEAYQPAVFNLAIIRKAAGDVEAAEQLYRRAIELRPGDAGAHLNLGLLLRETGRTTEGDAEVATALTLNPEFVDPAKK